MKSRPFPLGMVVTLVILWLGLVGAIAWGWWSLRGEATLPLPSTSTASRSAAPGARGPEGGGSGNGRLVWSNDALWRFSIKAGGAALGAIVFLLVAVGAGMLVQEKAESVTE